MGILNSDCVTFKKIYGLRALTQKILNFILKEIFDCETENVDLMEEIMQLKYT